WGVTGHHKSGSRPWHAPWSSQFIGSIIGLSFSSLVACAWEWRPPAGLHRGPRLSSRSGFRSGLGQEVSPPQPWSQRRLALGPGVGGEVLIGGRASCPGTARDYRRGRATVSGSTSGRSRSTLVAVV